ncbi:MAG: cation transporter [Ottowia sp.]|nr:cation transporter [Ottowia sp.]
MHSHSFHEHRHGDASMTHCRTQRSQRVLLWSLILTFLFSLVEAGAGWMANSLALISDAGHMATDSAALGLAWLAQFIARRPPSTKHSFGLGRIEALVAFVNALIMLAVVAWVVIQAITRLHTPQVVHGGIVMVVALIGLMVNVIVVWVLSRDRSSVNSRAALLHVWSDLLGSLAALVAGVAIEYTAWTPIDPLLSLLVSVLILKSTWSVLREAYHFLMEGVPHRINYEQVGISLSTVTGVISVHDLHVWDITPGEPALIGHVVVDDLAQWPLVLEKIRDMLRARYNIDHITLQPELQSMQHPKLLGCASDATLQHPAGI